MAKATVTRGSLQVLLVLVPGISLIAWIVALVLPGGGFHLSLPTFLLLAGTILSALAWVQYTRTISGPYPRILQRGNEISDDLEGLSQALVKVSTGDLAASVSVQAPPALVVQRGDIFPIAQLFNRLGTAILESVNGFSALTDPPCQRLCYVGSDSFAEGKMNGDIIGKLTGGQGKIAILVADIRSVNHALRRKGVLSTLAEKYPGVVAVGTADTNENPETTYQRAKEFLLQYRDLKIIYVSEGGTPQEAARAIVDLDRGATTKVVTHDLTAETVPYLERGIIAATLSQAPFAQGYNPVIHLYNHIVAGWEPVAPRLLVNLVSINPENYRTYWDAQTSGSSTSNSVRRANLSTPMERSVAGKFGDRRDERIKIAVLCVSENGFWTPVAQGAKAAGMDLADRNVQVDLIIPEASKDGILSAATYAPVIEKLVAQQYHGISLPIFDRSLIPVINRAVQLGLTVVTFNSEPVSLREMVVSISNHATKLIDMSQELAASATESGRSNERINATMEKISQTLQNQLKEVDQTASEIDTLVSSVEEINSAAASSADSAKRMAEVSKQDLEALGAMRAHVKDLQKSVALTHSSIEALQGSVDRIGSIIAAIGDIANQTNVLAINASIEAARAGDQGKGFSVLAGEIRKLAEQSTRSAGEIDRLIADIRAHVQVAFAETKRVSQEANQSADTAQTSETVLEEVYTISQENKQKMETIFAAVETLQTFSRKVAQSMRTLAETNKSSAGAIGEIVASTTEMTAQAMDVAKTAHGLSELAKGQQVLLSQFRLDGSTHDQGRK